ncbi:MAG: B3/4 domain-containing protein [Calditrichia bacterium]
MTKISIAEELQGTIKIAALNFSGLNCQRKNTGLWNEIEEVANSYRAQFPEPSAATKALKPARQLYHSIGMEPTRHRPSSEALLRRAIKGKPLYQINSIVDVSNLCSLKFLLPIGLYDVAKISGAVWLRKGKTGEEYPGIRKEMIHVADRYTLADDLGPFGNPSADSLRTSITLKTRDVLLVIFAPFNYPDDIFKHHVEETEKTMLNYHQGVLSNKAIIK